MVDSIGDAKHSATHPLEFPIAQDFRELALDLIDEFEGGREQSLSLGREVHGGHPRIVGGVPELDVATFADLAQELARSLPSHARTSCQDAYSGPADIEVREQCGERWREVFEPSLVQPLDEPPVVDAQNASERAIESCVAVSAQAQSVFECSGHATVAGMGIDK